MDNSLLIAVFALLAASVALVPLSNALGFGSILGYLAAGILIGPYGLGQVTDTEVIRHISEFGIVMMLFLIGLELQPLELWRMRNKVAGLGLTQYIGTALLLGAIFYLLDIDWRTAVILSLALAMSSTAIALQTVAARGVTRTDTGRGSLAILLVQDVAVIPVLALVPLLGTAGRSLDDATPEAAIGWGTALGIVAAFVFVVFAGRFLIRPLMRFVAGAGVREAFTILGLALVVGAALLTQRFGLSPALGAFMGGVLLADSEYRHELETNLEPFKGILLGLFFISVGTSISFTVLTEQPLTVLAIVGSLVSLKALVVFLLATLFRMHLADRLLLALLLSQAGEFGFVVLQLAQSTGAMPLADIRLFTVAIALSMAVTPLLIFVFDRAFAVRLRDGAPDRQPDNIDSQNKVIVLGYGRFGQIVTRLLSAQGFEMTLIDHDPAQIDLVKHFGVKVFYGDGTRLDMLHAAGAEDAELIAITLSGRDRILDTARMIRQHFPGVKIAARAIDRRHAQDLMDIGVDIWERETFRSALALGERALTLLGYSPARAARLAKAFSEHDLHTLEETRALRGDDDAFIGYMRRDAELLNRVLQADIGEDVSSGERSTTGD